VIYIGPGDVVQEEIERADQVAGVVLQTGFGALIAGLALIVAIDDEGLRWTVAATTALSGLAACLAIVGLSCSIATDPPLEVLVRKWLGGRGALAVMLAALTVAMFGIWAALT
jgi:hypothetical protein